ncbi:uncharacterized protein LOC111122729 [Crassostrea virginica]
MASESTVQGQEVVNCDLCQNPVSFFCQRCGVNLCDSCVPVHLRVKSKFGHVILDFASKDFDDFNFCISHSENECSAYCKTCEVPICILCVSIKHRSHEISELHEKIEELLKAITEENERLQSSRSDLEIIQKHTIKRLSSLSSFYERKKDEVTARGEEWHNQVNSYVQKLHQELDDIKSKHEAILQKQKKEFDEMIQKLDEMNRKSNILQKSKNVLEMQKFKSLIEKQETTKEILQYTFPKFQAPKTDNKFLQTNFGHIENMQERRHSLTEEISQPDVSNLRLLEKAVVSFTMDVGVPARNGDNNRLYDMAAVEGNKVWVSGSSNLLQLFDLQGNLQHTLTIPYKGSYLCTYNGHAVFRDYNDKTLKKISDDDTVVTMFTTGNWIPYGITGSSSGDLLVCLRKSAESKVVRYSSNGTILQEIQYDSQCQPLYQCVWYIAENINGDIVVTDFNYKKKQVIAVNRLGIFRYTYSEKESAFHPMGVVTDSLGHVIVANFLGHKVHLLDKDGHFLRYIIPEGGINYPRAVCKLDNGDFIIGESVSCLVKGIKFFEWQEKYIPIYRQKYP